MSISKQTISAPIFAIILDEQGEERPSTDIDEIFEYIDDLEGRRLAKDTVLDFIVSTVHLGHKSNTKNVNYQTNVTPMSEHCHPVLINACAVLSKNSMSKMEAADHHNQVYLFLHRLAFLPYGRSWRATKKQFCFGSKHNAEGRHLATSIRQTIKQQRKERWLCQ